PEYQSRDLYLIGSAYAGRVIPEMVETFEEKEQKLVELMDQNKFLDASNLMIKIHF
ncbi:unnamed protein product, partial [Allacma fusca]